MILKKEVISPKQPYFVMNTSQYYKAVVMNYGISNFYAFRRNRTIDSSIFAIPDGSIDIYFCCDKKNPSAYVCGTVLHPEIAFTEDNQYLFGVRFLPGNCIKSKNASMSDFVSSRVPFLDVMGDKRLFEGIITSRNFENQIKLFMHSYLKSYYDINTIGNRENLNRFLVSNIIENAGQMKIEELAEKTKYSVRYINKVFVQEFGLTPKSFSKMIRFQNLLSNLNELESGMFDTNLTEITMKIGYYDQSHMIKDFEHFTNTTPSKYMGLLRQTQYNKRLIIV